MTHADLRELTWHTSSYTGNTGNCVEVAELPSGARFVRDTKNREGGMLTVSHGAWSAFTSTIKSGRLDG